MGASGLQEVDSHINSIDSAGGRRRRKTTINNHLDSANVSEINRPVWHRHRVKTQERPAGRIKRTIAVRLIEFDHANRGAVGANCIGNRKGNRYVRRSAGIVEAQNIQLKSFLEGRISQIHTLSTTKAVDLKISRDSIAVPDNGGTSP